LECILAKPANTPTCLLFLGETLSWTTPQTHCHGASVNFNSSWGELVLTLAIQKVKNCIPHFHYHLGLFVLTELVNVGLFLGGIGYGEFIQG
jgi:hypothetical protein